MQFIIYWANCQCGFQFVEVIFQAAGNSGNKYFERCFQGVIKGVWDIFRKICHPALETIKLWLGKPNLDLPLQPLEVLILIAIKINNVPLSGSNSTSKSE